MNVLIKGLEIPGEGAIRVVIQKHCGIAVAYTGRDPYQMAHEVVELPEKHGRLVDADAFMADICRSINEMTKIGIMVDGDYLWCKLEDALENAPTIVESEGEDA